MKMNLKDIEKILKNYLDYIKTNSSPIKKTSDFVWGKNVIRLKDLGNSKYEIDEHELENWYISLPCNEETYVPALVGRFKELVRQKDNPQSMTCETAKDYTCHQLCDWEWLENDNGEIVQNGKVTLVKYAIILKDLENNKVAESEIKANDEAFTHWQNECENKITIEKRKAVKEFAEKLKIAFHFYIVKNEDTGKEINTDDFIDELLKEYEK